MIRTHPVSGRKALFVNEGFTTGLLGVSEKESEALLGYLFAHATAGVSGALALAAE